jgi:hypothetical protein
MRRRREKLTDLAEAQRADATDGSSQAELRDE